MADPALTRLEGKIDSLTTTIQEVNTAVTALTTRMESWPDIVKQVADHEKRLTAMEQVEVKKYDERLDKLEQAVSGFKGWLAGATAVALAAGGLVTWFLSELLSTPAS